MAHGTRTLRVAERVRVELSTLLSRSVRDPAVAGIAITVVRMTPDLQIARVYYTVAEGSDHRDVARGLRRARPYLRRAVGERLQLRRAPDLQFLRDNSAEKQDRIARIFDTLERERTAAAAVTDDEEKNDAS